MSQSKKPIALAIGATLAGGLMLSGSAFASTQLAQGYLLGAHGQDATTFAKSAEGSCGGDKQSAEGKCGEGKCGAAEMDTDKDGKVSRAEFTAAHADMAAKFDKMDTNKDGYLDADEGKMMHAEGRCGSDKKQTPTDASSDDMSGDKAGEGKCGEGKCGGGI